jgi:hypothetical protein
MSFIQDQHIDKVPARIKVPAKCTFEVFDKDENMVCHNTAPSHDPKDVLLDSTERVGNGVDPETGPFVVKFTEHDLIKEEHTDDFPEGI